MNRFLPVLMFVVVSIISNAQVATQDVNPSNILPMTLPNVIQLAGTIPTTDDSAKNSERVLTFGIYQSQVGGTPIWTETQTVDVTASGTFKVLLGSETLGGLPGKIFSARQPQWIGIATEDGIELTRVALTTSPYAFKAADSDTLSGMHANDFVARAELAHLLERSQLTLTPNPAANLTVPIATGSSDTTHGLDAEFLRGFGDEAFAKLTFPNTFSRTQTLSGGAFLNGSVPDQNGIGLLDSAPLVFETRFGSQATPAPATTTLFSWAAKPPASSGKLSRLALSVGMDGATPTETGLSLNSDGTIQFAPGQQFPASAIRAALVGTQDNGSSGNWNAPVVNTSQFAWSQTESTSTTNGSNGPVPISVGSNEITLTPCPRGLNGSDLWHYIYISQSGTPEVVLVTGGTCTSNASSGTIQFSASYAHALPYTIGSATDGIQEAVIAAIVPGTGGQSRQVQIDPGTHLLRARLSIRASNITLTSTGAVLTCAMKDTCIMMGDPSNSNLFNAITLNGLRVSASIPGNTFPALEDNASGSFMINIGPAQPVITNNTIGTFGSMIQVDNDQAATIDGLNTNLASWQQCNTTFCSVGIYGPGPFSRNAGVIWVKNSNLAMQCAGNGIDNQDGNTLNISTSVIEAYAQFGVRARTVYATSTVQMNGVYTEVGNCQNPLGTGQGGLVVQGGTATSQATTGPSGQLPLFSNTGVNRYLYYVVVNSSEYGPSIPLLAGQAYSDGSTPIHIVWNKVGTAGVISYDVLRVPGSDYITVPAPSGTEMYAVAVGLSASTTCTGMVCSFIDNPEVLQTSYTSYTQTDYFPALWNWPAGVVLTTVNDAYATGGTSVTKYFTDVLSGVSVVSSYGASQPSVFAQECDTMPNYTAVWVQCAAGNALGNDNPGVEGTVYQEAGFNAPGGLKGRIIFSVPLGSDVSASHVVTLMDSNPEKTQASPISRPTWDPSDTFIGYDAPVASASTMQLSFGAPVAISNYINNVGDNVNWLERLAASQKTFRVPVQVPELLSGSTSNTDLAGTIAISGETSGSYLFAGQYDSAPHCFVTPLGDTSAVGTYWINETPTQLTIFVKTAGSVTFNYSCIGTTVPSTQTQGVNNRVPVFSVGPNPPRPILRSYISRQHVPSR